MPEPQRVQVLALDLVDSAEKGVEVVSDGEMAAGQMVAINYDRRRNLRQFADQFLARIAPPESAYASSLLQQVQLPV